MDLEDIAVPERLNRAVELYLHDAYDEARERESHAEVFEPGVSPEEALGRFRDETEEKPDSHRCYTLRLGSQEYPYMKLAIQEAYYHGEYIYAVDRHDTFRFDRDTPGYAEWLSLRNCNRQRKIRIEEAWYEAGLPTLRRLKETALTRSDTYREFTGQEILLVDDDADACAIVSLILKNAGFKTRTARSVEEAVDYIHAGDCACGLAIIDVVMADGSGLDVIAALRGEPATQDVPVVLVTGMSHSDVFPTDVARFIRKPYNGQELVGVVEETLRTCFDGSRRFLDSRENDE